MESWPLAGKVALVTGGSRGIGREIAIQFAKRGANAVAITFRVQTEAANATVAAIQAHGTKAIAIQTEDPMDLELADSVKEQVLEAFSRIDILVCNAGSAILLPMGSITPEEFFETYQLNVLAPLLLIRAVLPVIRAEGSIVAVTSISARTALGGVTSLYASSKAAIEHLMRNLATTHSSEKNITMNCVAPGPTDTDAFKELPEHISSLVRDEWTPFKRIGRADEVADIVCFLVGGGGARWINGDTIAACGGASMY